MIFFSLLHHIYKSRTLCWLIHWFSDHLLSNDPASSPGFATVNTLIHLPASSLGTTSCPPSIHPLCRTMSGDYNPSPFVQSLVYTHTRLITRFSHATQNLAQPCVKTNTYTCTRPSYCWFTVTHNSGTTCWKVGWRSVMLCTVPVCIFGCLTVAFCVCMWILIEEKGRSKTSCGT